MGSEKVAKLVWVLLVLWIVSSLSSCVQRARPQAGSSNIGKTDSVSPFRDEKNPEGGYRLVASKDYRYGSGPGDFGIERGVPPVACGGFSAGGAEGNLYILDLVNRNVKILQKTDAALLKVVKLPGEAMGEEPDGFPWAVDIAVDKDGVIYVLAVVAGQTRVVAFDDTGRVLSVRPVPEGFHWLAKTREGRVVLASGDQGFRDCSFAGRRCCIEIDDRREVLELSRFEGSILTGLGRYRVAEGEREIASAGFVGENGSGNAYAWVQVQKPPVFRLEKSQAPEDVRLGVLKFSEKGELLDVLFVPEDDYFAMYVPKFFDVGRDGSIYQLIPAEEFLKVRVWTSGSRSASGCS